MLCRHDFTFRRYNGPDDVDDPKPAKPARLHHLSDFETCKMVRVLCAMIEEFITSALPISTLPSPFTFQDGPQRLLIKLKPHVQLGVDGEDVIKLSADTEEEAKDWFKSLNELMKKQVDTVRKARIAAGLPVSDDEDDVPAQRGAGAVSARPAALPASVGMSRGAVGRGGGRSLRGARSSTAASRQRDKGSESDSSDSGAVASGGKGYGGSKAIIKDGDDDDDDDDLSPSVKKAASVSPSTKKATPPPDNRPSTEKYQAKSATGAAIQDDDDDADPRVNGASTGLHDDVFSPSRRSLGFSSDRGFDFDAPPTPPEPSSPKNLSVPPPKEVITPPISSTSQPPNVDTAEEAEARAKKEKKAIKALRRAIDEADAAALDEAISSGNALGAAVTGSDEFKEASAMATELKDKAARKAAKAAAKAAALAAAE